MNLHRLRWGTLNALRAEFGDEITPHKVAALSEHQIKCTPGIGKVAFSEIQRWLSEYELEFSDDDYSRAIAKIRARQDAERAEKAAARAETESRSIQKYTAYLEKRGYRVTPPSKVDSSSQSGRAKPGIPR